MMNDVQIIGVESKTSSPVKIQRDKETLNMFILKDYCHVQKAQVMQAAS
jgi:uncharacterized FAD-dependent dehydrogenase